MEAATVTRDLFVNESGGWQGVVTIEPGGTTKAISVAPGHEVWLTKDEQVLTANSTRREEDNPLVNGALRCVTEAAEVANRRPLRPAAPVAETPEDPAEQPAPPEEIGAPPQTPGEPNEGQRAPNEEVGTPDAAAQPSAPPLEPEPPQDPSDMREESPMRPATTEDDPTRPQLPKDQLPRPVARRG